MSLGATKSGLKYANPVYPRNFADPFVFRHGGGYFAVGTGDAHPSGAFQMLSSPNLVDWTPLGPGLHRPAEFVEGTFWAPEISHFDGGFFMYYSVGIGDTGHHLRLAFSEVPEGPYEDCGRLSAESIAFAIDPHVYVHVEGTHYLFYASDVLEGDRPGTCLFVDQLLEPDRLAGHPVLVAHATADWQRFEAGRSIYGGVYDWHTLEGPCAVWRDGKVYVLYSGGNWQNDTYGVDFVVAEHPMGPYRNETRDQPRTLRTVPGKVLGPGHNSVTMGPDGETMYIVYHAWDAGRTGRLMRIDPLLWTEAGPVADGPSIDRRD